MKIIMVEIIFETHGFGNWWKNHTDGYPGRNEHSNDGSNEVYGKSQEDSENGSNQN